MKTVKCVGNFENMTLDEKLKEMFNQFGDEKTVEQQKSSNIIALSTNRKGPQHFLSIFRGGVNNRQHNAKLKQIQAVQISIKCNCKDSEEWGEPKSLTASLNQLVKHTVKDLQIITSVMEQKVGLDTILGCFSLVFCCFVVVCLSIFFKN